MQRSVRWRAGALLALGVLLAHGWLLAGRAEAPGAGPHAGAPRAVLVRQRAPDAAPAAPAREAPLRPVQRPNAASKAAPQPAAAAASEAPAPTTAVVAAADVPTAPESGGLDLPLYATRPPPAARLRYAVQRGTARGQAELLWQPQAARYVLTLQSRIEGLPPLAWNSSGALAPEGLQPERYVESRRGRERLATNFQRPPDGPGRITFSGPQVELALPGGAQDRLSWTLQLAAVLDADPALAKPGGELRVFVVGTRGDGEAWVFQVLGREDLVLPAGPVAGALHLRREPRRPYDTLAEAWFDPARHHLPVRLRLAVRPAAAESDFLLEALETDTAVP
jgi:hypothetical protein